MLHYPKYNDSTILNIYHRHNITVRNFHFDSMRLSLLYVLGALQDESKN
jgi:hypothetical protein